MDELLTVKEVAARLKVSRPTIYTFIGLGLKFIKLGERSVRFRPSEVDTLLGDSSLACEELGWKPQISFSELVSEMIREDLKKAEQYLLLKDHGYQVDYR